MKPLILAALLCAPSAALAELSVRFIEGAPKDRFEITHAGCPLSNARIELDLAPAPAGLIFDVTASGAGVEVFQPVEVVSGRMALSRVSDGDQRLTLDIPSVTPGRNLVISADLDDTLAQSDLGQIRVSGAEIAGAEVRLSLGDMTWGAVFDTSGRAVVATRGCPG